METLLAPASLPTAETPNHKEPITILTDNPDVVLRQLTPDDAEVFFGTIDNERREMEMIRFGRHVRTTHDTLDRTRAHIESAEGNEGERVLSMGIWDQGELAGGVLLKPHKTADVIEYWLAKNHRGRGVARSAVSAAIAYAFEERGATQIIAGIYRDNIGSRKLVRALGFIPWPGIPNAEWYQLSPEQFAEAVSHQ